MEFYNSIFSCCYSLEELPDISKWFNIENLNIDNPEFKDEIIRPEEELIFTHNERDENTGLSFSYMFYDCSSLKSLPDISKWKISNIIYTEGLFCGCSSLISIPDISKWKMDFALDISEMFYECSSLIFYYL